MIDSHPIHRKAWQQFLRTLGREVSETELDYILDGRRRGDILCHFLGALSPEQLLEYGQRKDLFFWESAPEVQPIAGLADFVEKLARRKIPMAVATSASESRTRFTLEQLRLHQHFRAIVTGKDVPMGKPAPDIYRMACERLGTEPARAIAFEDAVSGVMAAKAAGLYCAGVLTHQSPSTLSAAGADLTVPDFTGLSLDDLEKELTASQVSASSQHLTREHV
jgi:HAD superfamily hydrolase (TIGR01509 family)